MLVNKGWNPWGQEVSVVAVSPTAVYFRIRKEISMMTMEEWARAVAK